MFTLGHRRCFAPALLTTAEGDFRFWPQSRPCAVHIPIDMLDPFSQRRVPNDVRYLASGPDTWRSRCLRRVWTRQADHVCRRSR